VELQKRRARVAQDSSRLRKRVPHRPKPRSTQETMRIALILAGTAAEIHQNPWTTRPKYESNQTMTHLGDYNSELFGMSDSNLAARLAKSQGAKVTIP
jgi:hypothetical protein